MHLSARRWNGGGLSVFQSASAAGSARVRARSPGEDTVSALQRGACDLEAGGRTAGRSRDAKIRLLRLGTPIRGSKSTDGERRYALAYMESRNSIGGSDANVRQFRAGAVERAKAASQELTLGQCRPTVSCGRSGGHLGTQFEPSGSCKKRPSRTSAPSSTSLSSTCRKRFAILAPARPMPNRRIASLTASSVAIP